ncbi:MAG TPA: DUF4436 family protein [Pseudonocardiaceae bacterium]|nr:DUF4436 family protein [Pseudonocardiaceae bacterium]
MTGMDQADGSGRAKITVRAAIAPFVVIIVIAALCALGIFGYFNERDVHSAEWKTGQLDAPNRVEVDVTLQRMDASARQFTLVVVVSAVGNLAEDGNEFILAHPLTLETSSLSNTTLRYPAGERISAQNISVGLDTGIVSDYPFDTYTTDAGFYASINDQPVPISLIFRNEDPFFLTTATGANMASGAATIGLRIERSRGTFIFAWFLMAAMWILALSVLAAALIIVRGRRGFIWPALGWMAATLFALVAVRNAVPGLPPIGSLFDYASFLWAEGIVAASIAAVTVQGLLVERTAR